MSAIELKERLRTDLLAAMRARASDHVRVVRMLLAAVDNAEAVPIASEGAATPPTGTRAFGDPSGEVPRREVDAAAIEALLAAEAETRRAAAAFCDRHGQAGEAERLRKEAELVERYRA